jgi:hypothetical protein
MQAAGALEDQHKAVWGIRDANQILVDLMKQEKAEAEATRDEQGKALENLQSKIKESGAAAGELQDRIRNTITIAGERVSFTVDTSGAVNSLNTVLQKIQEIKANAQVSANVNFTGEASPRRPLAQTVDHVKGLLAGIGRNMGLNFDFSGVTGSALTSLQRELMSLQDSYRELTRIQQIYHQETQQRVRLGRRGGLAITTRDVVYPDLQKAIENAQLGYRQQLNSFNAALASARSQDVAAPATIQAGGNAEVVFESVQIQVGSEATGKQIGVEFQKKVADDIRSRRSPIPPALRDAGYLS